MAMRKSLVIAGVLAAGLAGWLASGQIDRDEPETDAWIEAEATNKADRIEAPTVRVRDLVAEEIAREVVVNGKTAPERSVRLRAETSGQVLEIGGREGDAVDRGAFLARLDPRDREVAALEAEALLRQRRIELDAARKLGEKGFQAETAVAAAEAAFATAEAVLKRAELELDRTAIAAPFAGTLDRRHVEIGDYVDVGDPIATLLDRDPMLVTGEVAETEVGGLEAGMKGAIRLATGEVMDGELRYIASQADEQTRTFEVELELANPDGRLAAGVSAEIRIAVERVPAHRVSPSVLVLSDAGELGVRTVGREDLVAFMPVEIARAEGGDVWLTGLPSEVRVISVGQGFVRDGTEVQPVPEQGDDGRNGAGPVVSEAVR